MYSLGGGACLIALEMHRNLWLNELIYKTVKEVRNEVYEMRGEGYKVWI